jgi:glycosyltransferase involved in cell wall biosynthesis
VNLTGTGDLKIIEQFNKIDVEIINLNYSFENGYTLLDQFKKAFFPRGNREIISEIVSLKPTILHFHTLPAELKIGREVQKFFSCKLVFTDHSTRVKGTEISLISKMLLKIPFKRFYRGYNVIAVSKSVANYHNEFNLCKSTIITNKIPPRFDRISYKEGTSNLNFVYVARISAVKGHKTLIQAWAGLPNLNLKLFIIGPDDLGGAIQQLVAELKVKNEIIFTGSINNVKEKLLQMDVGIFPSNKEGLPLALLEKMQVGLPCIVSDIEELTDIVDDKINGLVFKQGNTEELKNKILELVNNPELRKKIGINAAQKIENEFVSKLGGLYKEYEAFYSKILT